jgi:hypothetical protein
VLELRLETLAPVVDAFILVEAPVTFQVRRVARAAGCACRR